jgi:uncharacterized protein (TIRG00374 family)
LRTQSKRGRRASVVGLLVSLVALVIAFWGAQPGRLVSLLGQVNYLYLVPAVLLLLLGLGARAKSWHTLLAGRVSFARAFAALNEGYLLNNVLPLRLGELGRAYVIAQGGQVGAAAALATVVAERVIDIVVSLAGLLVSLPFVVAPQWALDLAWTAGGVLAALIAILAVLLFNRRILRALLERLPGVLGWSLSSITEQFLSALDRLVRQPARLLLAAFWSLAAWVTTWLELWILLEAFRAAPSWAVPLFTSGVNAFGAALPSSPGAVGVYELSTVAGLAVFGYERNLALGVAVLAHVLVLGMTSLIGGVALLREGQTLLTLAERVRKFLRGLQRSEAQ